MSGLGLQSCQQQGLSKFKDDKRKPDREKVASDKDGKRKKDMSGEMIPRDDNQAVRLRS